MADPISYSQRVSQLARERPDEVAAVFWQLDDSDATFTWSRLHQRSSQVAGALRDRGLGLGDRLAVALRNSPEFVLSVLAAWKLGAVPVPMRWDLPEWELERVREVIDPTMHLEESDLPWLRDTADDPVPELPDAVSPQRSGICSSGSTGTPKVIMTERPALFTGVTPPFATLWGPVPTPETILVPAPMYHTNGFAPLTQLLGGDRLIVMQKFSAAAVVDLIERHRVSHVTATPTMLQRIADLPGVDQRDLSSIQWVRQGAASMPPSLVRRWIDLIGAERLVMAYGMTEGFGLCALRGDEWLEHEGSVGRGARGTEVRILDESGAELPPGEIGTVYLRTPGGASYSYRGKAKPASATEDGFHTGGDIGYLDRDGYLFLKDRAVDMIVSGGANVFPAEVEAALIDHAQVADVVVIGLRDPEWGRRVHAVVEPVDQADPPTAQELIAYAKSRLAAYKVPKTVELVESMPRSAATKVNRGAMVASRGG
ncbi:AMP-binding protein [Streptomyces sp. NPDC048106]|uniref:class I adenylate-forming enzyme family protein n=1 Tax=Streptomyces sp. NPDC048106 TaxID=3155750 RepID=UPI003453980C